MKVNITLIIILMILPMAIAATDTNDVDDVFKVNDVISYKKPCFNNGTYCSAAANCNVTIFKPDNTILLDNQRTTNQGAYHNISFSTDETGLYQADMTCVDGGQTGAETFYFEVTGSGLNNTVWFYVIILFLSFGVMALGFYLTDAPIVILGTFGLYFLGIYILMNGIVGIKDMTTTWATGIIVLGLAAYVSTKSAHELITG